MKNHKGISLSVQNRQKLSKNYSPNGSLYIFNFKELKRKKTFMTKNTLIFLMKRNRSFDIDTKEDFEIVKRYLEK